MNKTCAEIARLKKCSRQAVNNFIARNKIQPSGKKGKLWQYDCSKEPLAGYIAVQGGAERETDDTLPPEPTRIFKPLNDLLAGKVPPGKKASSFFYLKAVEIADKNKDAALLAKLGQVADKEDRDEIYQQQMLKTEQAKESIAIAKAERLKLENDIKRGQYMDKSTVKLLFGKTYAVHTGVLIPLGLKLADMIDALPPSPGRRSKIQEMIDVEMFSALETIKQLIIEFVQVADLATKKKD